MNWSCDQIGSFLIKVLVLAHAVHLAGAWENNALVVTHAVAHHAQILLKVQLKHAQWISHVLNRRGNGHQRQNHIALAHVVFNPLAVDGNVALDKVKAGMIRDIANVVRAQIHSVHFKAFILQQAFREMASNETVHAKN